MLYAIGFLDWGAVPHISTNKILTKVGIPCKVMARDSCFCKSIVRKYTMDPRLRGGLYGDEIASTRAER